MIAVCIGGGIGGAIAGYSGAKAIAFAFPSLASLSVFYGDGFLLYILSDVIAAIIAFIIAYCLKFKVDLAK